MASRRRRVAIGPPVLGKLDTGPCELPGILLELGLEALEKRKGVGGRPGKTSNDIIAAEAPDLSRIGLEHGLSEGHLPVTGDHHLVTLADR